MTRTLALLLTLATLATLASPATAMPTDLAAPVLAVKTTGHGNVLNWDYPSGVKANHVASIEVWRFDGSNTGTLVEKVHGNHTSYTDSASNNLDAFYTMRYTTTDGGTSNFSSATSGHYPYCDILIVGLTAPYLTGPQTQCALPLPIAGPYVSQVVAVAQNLVG